mmetsp:Transcript_22965/g.63705  ORF Transcript_22965/g.63705 Transcript_22965/m.63705 type:complete len:541 (-) Transcript_22965:79-1701(-)
MTLMMDPEASFVDEEYDFFGKPKGRNPMRQSSRWDSGIGCIDSLLRPGSATLAAMTNEQRRGLNDLKAMIMFSGDVEESAKNHIPQALLDSSESSSSDFLLSEYAGYDRRSEIRPLSNSISKVLSAQRVALKIKRMARKSVRESLDSLRLQSLNLSERKIDNMPEYWFDLDDKSKLKIRDLLSWDNLCRWDFDVFEVDEVLKGTNTLVFVAWAIIAAPHSQYIMDLACLHITSGSDSEIVTIDDRDGYDFISSLNIKETTLLNFLAEIEKLYKDVHFHNKTHAADVTQSLHSLFQMGGEKYADGKLETFSMLIAAVIHDVGHPGLNNPFLINSKSDLALVYNDGSVLENMHLSTMFRLIIGNNRDRQLDIFENFIEEEFEVARKLIIKAVLTTDMTKHFAKVNTIKGIILAQEDDESKSDYSNLQMDLCFMSEILSFALHAADISNPTRDTSMAIKWADRFLQESFHQGDMEEQIGLPFSPNCDRNATSRPSSQIGFIKFIILPTFQLLGQLIPRVSTEIIPKINDNLKFWQEQDRPTRK